MRAKPPRMRVKLSEVVATLSLGADLGMGQPLGWSLSTALLALQFAERLGLSDEDRETVFFLALLGAAGCTADAATLTAAFGDDLEANQWLPLTDFKYPAQLLFGFVQRVEGEGNLWARTKVLTRLLQHLPQLQDSSEAHCEVAQNLARRLGMSAVVQAGLWQLYERWDGRGLPRRLVGEQIMPVANMVRLCQDAVIFLRLAGPDSARAAMRSRAGGLYSPHLAETFDRHALSLFATLEVDSVWEALIAADPCPDRWLEGVNLERALETIGHFADLKSAFTRTHSSGVARVAEQTAQTFGLSDLECERVLLAGFLHDLGRVGVSVAVWDKPGALTGADWEQVRLHPYHTQRTLAQCTALRPVGELAAQHHERLDGSGYHRNWPAPLLSPSARILQVADAYQAMTESRSYRAARTPPEILSVLAREAHDGRLDPEIIAALRTALGHKPQRTRTQVAGLSERELEVLRLIAVGRTNKAMAKQLGISPKTVGHHVQHIYDKVGVTTRAAATLFAMEHHLL